MPGFTSRRTLFVVWQEPVSRARRTVGRLIRHLDASASDGDRQNVFEFAYTRGADEAAGFEPFIAFPHIDRVYTSNELPPFFANRLMSPRRPDHARHVSRLGLRPKSDPFDVLARTGGRRATDSIELYGTPVAVVEPGGHIVCQRTWFLAHGIRRLNEEEQAALRNLRPGDALTAQPNSGNPEDDNAMLLLRSGGHRVGYLPRHLAADVAEREGFLDLLGVTVVQVNPPPSPEVQRLLCQLDLKLPAGHTPFSGPMHRPRRADLAFDLAAAADPRTVAGSA